MKRVTLFIAGVLLACATCAVQAAPADAALQRQWAAQNDHCLGDQKAPESNPACARRDALGQQLALRGWNVTQRGFWYSAEAKRQFAYVMADVQNYVLPGCTPSNWSECVNFAIDDLRRNLPDEATVAVWNDYAVNLKGHVPMIVYAIMRQACRQIGLDHQPSNDVRWLVDVQ